MINRGTEQSKTFEKENTIRKRMINLFDVLFQDKLEAKIQMSQTELGKAKAELERNHADSSRYNDYGDWRQKLTKIEMDNDRLR